MRLLIVGTLNGQIGAATQIAMARGAKVSHAETVEAALASLRSGRGADLVMVDVQLDIRDFLDRATQEHIFVPVVACGIGTDAQAAVRAIKAGAKEYIPLPPQADLIAAVLEAVADENHPLIYRDAAMQAIIKLADQVAPSEASIMITGESGTGKEVLARYVHRKSSRAKMPFVSVNCAAIPENLLESELFGHEKGAFTGAIGRRVGKFEEADGGTLLLDEISEMDIRLQAKLLRAVQEREIDRVGGSKPVKVNIRVIATSNRDMAEEVRVGNFREDLLFRLNVVNLKIPPLRERPEDIRILSEHFAKKYAAVNGLPERSISAAALQALQSSYWKGNVRELENTIHRAVLLNQEDEVSPQSILLPDGRPRSEESRGPGITTDGKVMDAGTVLVGRTVADVEQELIINTLRNCLGNRTHAANILGISIRTLRNKLKQYGDDGISVPVPGDGMQAHMG